MKIRKKENMSIKLLSAGATCESLNRQKPVFVEPYVSTRILKKDYFYLNFLELNSNDLKFFELTESNNAIKKQKLENLHF